MELVLMVNWKTILLKNKEKSKMKTILQKELCIGHKGSFLNKFTQNILLRPKKMRPGDIA